ncbi:MAG: DUF937 domain-containing protein, partial [Anaerolineales bacterium]
MDSILQLIISQLGGDTVSKISDKLGIDETQAQRAIGLALPVIIGALNRNASSAEGAQSLTNALQRDHDGSILENLSQKIGQASTIDDGMAILGHIFGEKQGGVESTVSKGAGLDPEKAAQLFAMLAPIVMGALGQIQQKKSLDAQGVSQVLQQERETVEQTTSGLTQLLDVDGDGDVTEEVINLGANLLGGLFGG